MKFILIFAIVYIRQTTLEASVCISKYFNFAAKLKISL